MSTAPSPPRLAPSGAQHPKRPHPQRPHPQRPDHTASPAALRAHTHARPSRPVTWRAAATLPALAVAWLVAGLIGGLIGGVLTAGSAAASPLRVGALAPAQLSLQTIDGATIELDELRGKVVVLAFWGIWCGPCQDELPVLQALEAAHRDDGLVILAINSDGSDLIDRVRQHAAERGWTMAVLMDDDAGSLARRFGDRPVTPYTVVIGRDGRVRWRHTGYADADRPALERAIRDALAQTP